MSGADDRRRAVAGVLAGLDEVEVRVDKLVTGGDGLARVEGVPLFISRAAPGDRARVRIVDRRPDYGRAEIVELVEPSPVRREAPCPHFGRCGGCDLQHIDDAAQSKLRAGAALETLRRIGNVEPQEVEVVTGAAWGYRLRAQLRTDEEGRVGYFARGSRDLVAVDACPVLLPELESVIGTLAEQPGALRPRIDLAVGDSGLISAAPPVPEHPGGAIRRTIAGHRFEFDARTFFQGHAGLLDDLYRVACGHWRGETALDLYAGVGLFSVGLAGRYDRVVGVESDRVAARYARRNVRRARLAQRAPVAGGCHIEVEGRSVEGFLPTWAEPVDRVLVDPPRGGLGRPVKRELKRIAAGRLTYVSCYPATLARDLRDLSDVYAVESVTLLDMFPQTGHIEAVVQMRLIAS
ncbi:MAG: TRAM domain-containing protein [Acidobacteriota bacterium]|nr:TRAM domain-containing protein [Acidobacteriota bacterium]